MTVSTFRSRSLYRFNNRTCAGAIIMRITVAAAVACLIGGIAIADSARAAIRKATSIPAQHLKSALQTLASDHDFQILYRTEVVGERRTGGAEGELSLDEALTRLLSGTGLSYEYLDEKTVTILPRESPSSVTPAPLPRQTVAPTDAAGAVKGDQKRSFWDRFRLAQTDSEHEIAGRSTLAADSSDSSASVTLEEVVVTAQKREERLIDVPISIVALSAEELQQRRVTGLDDLSMVVPSLFVWSTGSGQRSVMLRGISNLLGNSPLIGLYLDEASATSGLQAQLDIRTYDLERIEVLRGPQGTLYGEGSAGGTIRFITQNPMLNRFAARADASGQLTEDGEWGQQVDAMINVPLVEDQLGFRIAGTYEHGGGWIDQPAAGKQDFNGQNLMDVRIKGLWQPAPQFAVNTMAVIHRNQAPPNTREDENGNFTQLFNLTTTPDITDDYDLFNLTLTYDFPSVRILSTSSYVAADKTMSNTGNPVQFLSPNPPRFQVYNPLRTLSADIFTDELRLTSIGPGPWQWTIGGFYRRFRYGDVNPGSVIGLEAPAGSPVPAPGQRSFRDTLSKSAAAFGDSSYAVTDRLTVGVGLRYFHDEQDFQRTSGVTVTNQTGSFHTVNPRAYVQYALTERANVYASAAKGFRSGGFNATPALPQYDPETVWTYELGTKLSVADGRLSADAAIFYSDYQSYQINGVDPAHPEFGNIISNAGDARIRGVEWGFTWLLPERWTVRFSGDYLDTEFVRINATSAQYNVGDPVDQFPKYGVTFSTQRDFNWGGREGFARLDYNRHGRSTYRNRNLAGPTPWYFSESGLIDMLNVNMSLQWTETLSVGFFGQNLLNDRAFVDPLSIEAAARSRPRTYGVELGVTF